VHLPRCEWPTGSGLPAASIIVRPV
jgi:hypothetical protein